jgi:hypothetical protein
VAAKVVEAPRPAVTAKPVRAAKSKVNSHVEVKGSAVEHPVTKDSVTKDSVAKDSVARGPAARGPVDANLGEKAAAPTEPEQADASHPFRAASRLRTV